MGDSFSENIEVQIQEKLQNLANNLYSKFVCITPEQIKKMENQQTQVRIAQYEFDMSEKNQLIVKIKSGLIEKLCKLIDIDEKTMKMNIVTNSDPSLKAREKVSSMDLME